MATRSVLAYCDDAGDLRGTYVHFDGHPDAAGPLIHQMLQRLGYDGVVKWIETGINGGGYRGYTDTKPFGDIKNGRPYPINSEEFGYVVLPDGTVNLLHATNPLSTPPRYLR